MIIFISGGCKNGKSSHGEALIASLRGTGPLYYLATMMPHDAEDEARIARHKSSRAHWGFTTVEVGQDILTVLGQCDPQGSFLLDSVTALLANAMFLPDGTVDQQAHVRLAEDLEVLLRSVKNLVLVSDYIYAEAACYDAFTEDYRSALAYLDCFCAARADVVLEAAAGTVLAYKGGNLLA